MRIIIMLLLMMVVVVRADEDAQVLGLRLVQVSSDQSYTGEGVISIQAGVETRVEIIGVNLGPDTLVRLTTAVMEEVINQSLLLILRSHDTGRQL